MRVVSTGNSEGLSSRISSILGLQMARVTRRRFADGELYVKVEEGIDGAIIVGNTYPDGGIIDILLTRDASWNAGARKLILIVPYFGYARQDSMFQNYEAVSARVISEILVERFDRIFVVNMHSPEGVAFLGSKGKEIRAEPLIGRKVKEDGNELVVSPDDGFQEEAARIASVAGLESIAMNKKRVSDTKVEISLPQGASVNGKVVALTDDLISTGGTILESSKILKEHGARRINVYCVHGLFVTGTSKYAGFVDSITTTDTVEGPFSGISVASLVSSEVAPFIT